MLFFQILRTSYSRNYKNRQRLKKCCKDKYVDLLLIWKEGKKHYALINNFNIFMYDHIFYRGTKNFLDIVYKLLEQQKN